MDTTADERVPFDRIEALLEAVTGADPAEAVVPLGEVADLLEALLDDEVGR